MLDPFPGPDCPPATPCVAVATTARSAPRTFLNPVVDTGTGRDHGDPFVLRHQGRYYLYYTGSAGIEVWTSTDLAHWTRSGLALVAADGDHWAQVDLWAPEVLYADGWFYMYVTGTRHPGGGTPTHPGAGVGVNDGDDEQRRQGIARSQDPLGPFRLDPAPLLGVWSIDGHPFVDVDGSRWLFYNVRDDSTRYQGLVPGCGNVVDELVAPDAVRGEPTPVALPDASWEGRHDGTWFWNEGPTVLRRRGRYVQMYSGGWYGDDSYGVGFAAADHPRGPWAKAPHNPVFVSGGRITGPGHHSVTVGPDGVSLYAVYHGYVNGEPGRKVHVDRLLWSTEGPRMGSGVCPGRPTEAPQPVPEGPAFDPDVPFWHAELWVRGTSVRLGELVVDLPPGRDVLLDITQRERVAHVRVDGRVVAPAATTGDAADVAADLVHGGAVDGITRSLALTTWRDDERVLTLAPGDTLEVAWGGQLPVELSVAATGACTVRLEGRGGDLTETATQGAGELPELVRLRSEGPVERVVVAAGALGAVVSDLVLTARFEPQTAIAPAPVPAPRPAADPLV